MRRVGYLVAFALTVATIAVPVVAVPDAPVDALVSFHSRPGVAELSTLQRAGVTVHRVFQNFQTAYVTGPVAAVAGLARLGAVAGVYDNARTIRHGATGTIASRAREAWDGKSTSTTPAMIGGSVVDGRGVGVAVVDSGIDGTHPDLAPALAGNKKWLCPTPFLAEANSGFDKCYGSYMADAALNLLAFDNSCNDAAWLDVATSDTTSGHGTHVAGIVAGRGVASNGRFMGAAPGAMLYGLGVGEESRMLWILEAFAWISCNAASVTPAIKVVNNSWGGQPGPHDPSDPISLAVAALVGKGITVVFSAGNDAGDGSIDLINPEAKNPLKGVISVADYDDAERATRTGSLSRYSSRGSSADANKENWPDVSAPGTSITSTGAKTGLYLPTGLHVTYEPYYTVASGTSMAAPHVAGIVAMLLQADPSLTPAKIEDLLEDTANQFPTPGGYVADPGNPTNGTNFGAGHGLADAIAAIHAAGATGGSSLPQIGADPHIYTGNQFDVQVVAGVQWTQPASVPFSLSERVIMSGDATVWPLSAGQPGRFVVTGPGCAPCVLPAALVTDTSATDFSMSSAFTPSAGTYVAEAQIDFGGTTGFASFDRFIFSVI
ncbi:MAG TPA: S8 family serine peptidase [Actinomycetota bacterium]